MANEPFNEAAYRFYNLALAGGLVFTGGGTAAAPSVVVGNVASGVADAGAPVKVAGVFNTTPAAVTTGQRRDIEVSARGSVFVSLKDGGNTPVAITAANVTAQQSAITIGLNTLSFPYKSDGTGWRADTLPTTASRIPSAANSTNATAAKAAQGQVHSVNGYNSTATVTYLKFYNKATAPTVGTDVPVLTLALPPLAVFDFDIGGMLFTTGIAYGLTTDAADAGTTAVAAASILGLNVVYT